MSSRRGQAAFSLRLTANGPAEQAMVHQSRASLVVCSQSKKEQRLGRGPTTGDWPSSSSALTWPSGRRAGRYAEVKAEIEVEAERGRWGSEWRVGNRWGGAAPSPEPLSTSCSLIWEIRVLLEGRRAAGLTFGGGMIPS